MRQGRGVGIGSFLSTGALIGRPLQVAAAPILQQRMRRREVEIQRSKAPEQPVIGKHAELRILRLSSNRGTKAACVQIPKKISLKIVWI